MEREGRMSRLVKGIKLWTIPGSFIKRVKEAEERIGKRLDSAYQNALTAETYRSLLYGLLTIGTISECIKHYYSL